MLERNVSFSENFVYAFNEESLITKMWVRTFSGSKGALMFDPFHVPILYPLRTPEKLNVFWCFQGV